jgi:hypothetical protein
MTEGNGVCIQVVPRELLDALASEAPVDTVTATRSAGRTPFASGSSDGSSGYQHRLLVERWLQDRGVEYRVKPQTDDRGRTVYVLKECPFDPSHGAPDSCIMQAADGKMSAQCFHDSCRGRGWQAFKRAIGKPGPEHYDPPMTPKLTNRTEDEGPETSDLIDGTNDPNAAQAGAGNGNQSAVARLRIRVTTVEHKVNDAAVIALRRDETLYQRGGVLVHVIRSQHDEEASGIYRPAGSPRIVTVPAALLRERLTRVAKYVKVKKSRNNEQKDVPAHPPAWCVRAVEARSDWPGIRHLAGIVDFPVLRPDGTILDTVGYDAATGLIYLSGGPTPSIPTQPTQQDVADAVALLLDLVADFSATIRAARPSPSSARSASRRAVT